MATQGTSLTNAVAVDVNAGMSLVDGTDYSIQAIGGEVCVTEQATAPTIGTSPYHVLGEDLEPWTYTARTGQKLYAWARFGKAVLVVTEA